MERESDLRSHLFYQGLRFVFMVAFWIASRIILFIVLLIASIQLVVTLITRRPNEALIVFGRDLGIYLSQIVNFLTYNTEEKPWPFQEWPASKGAPGRESGFDG